MKDESDRSRDACGTIAVNDFGCGTDCRSPGTSSAGSVVASGIACPALAVGTTSRRNQQRPRAWHPGPNGNPAGRHTKLEEPELRAEGGAAGPPGRGKEGTAGGETRDRGVADRYQPHTLNRGAISFLSLLPHPPHSSLSLCLSRFDL